jgi:hypothetical protein
MMETVDTAAARVVRLHNLLIEYIREIPIGLRHHFLSIMQDLIDFLLMSIKRSCAERRESGLECNLQRPTIINKYMYRLYSNICCV